MDYKKLTVYILITLLATFMAGRVVLAAASDDVDAYKKAYALIGEEKWKDALGALSHFIDEYTDSEYVDDAGYWYCYAMERSGADDEKALQCYESFLSDYQDSKWEKAAKSQVIVLAKKLSKNGHTEYKHYLKGYEKNGEDEIAITAIHALGERGDERSLVKLQSIYDKKKNKSIRKAVIFAISQNESKKALDYLYQIVQDKSDPSSQGEAVFWLSQREEKEAAGYVEKVLFGDYSAAILKKAVFAAAELEHGGFQLLEKVVKNHKDETVRAEAVFWISQTESKDAVAFLGNLAFTDKSEKVQLKAVFGLSQIETEQSVNMLVKIAKEHKSIDVRKQAIFWLGEIEHPAAEKALDEIIDSL
ncbi:MAG: HEAT repeat domain-containing protein [Acidobacteria bacterium]|nr:HEAT repeat domain-containing protein [Acidobacteriota bacterium]